MGDFWDMTPYELSLYADGYAKRKKAHDEEVVTQAWLIATLSRAKTIPKLETLLKPKQKIMSEQQLMNQAIALTKLFGGKVIIAGEEEEDGIT